MLHYVALCPRLFLHNTSEMQLASLVPHQFLRPRYVSAYTHKYKEYTNLQRVSSSSMQVSCDTHVTSIHNEMHAASCRVSDADNITHIHTVKWRTVVLMNLLAVMPNFWPCHEPRCIWTQLRQGSWNNCRCTVVTQWSCCHADLQWAGPLLTHTVNPHLANRKHKTIYMLLLLVCLHLPVILQLYRFSYKNPVSSQFSFTLCLSCGMLPLQCAILVMMNMIEWLPNCSTILSSNNWF